MLNVGLPITKQSVDAAVGGLAARLAQIAVDAERVYSWLAGVNDQDLTALGYTADDITALRGAGYAYGVLSQVYSGQVNLPNATDFRVGIRRLAGLG